MTFRNEATQKERAAILKNDLKMQTLQGRAIAELQMEERGRFARNVNVTASETAPVAYPGAPWTQDHLGQEPPLGFDVNEVPAIGEPHEIEASLLATQQKSSLSVAVATGDALTTEATEQLGTPEAQLEASPSSSKPRLMRRPLR